MSANEQGSGSARHKLRHHQEPGLGIVDAELRGEAGKDRAQKDDHNAAERKFHMKRKDDGSRIRLVGSAAGGCHRVICGAEGEWLPFAARASTHGQPAEVVQRCRPTVARNHKCIPKESLPLTGPFQSVAGGWS